MIPPTQVTQRVVDLGFGSILDLSAKGKTNFHLKQKNALVRQNVCDCLVEKIIEELHFSIFCTNFFRLY